jgi:hypothetical protein
MHVMCRCYAREHLQRCSGAICLRSHRTHFNTLSHCKRNAKCTFTEHCIKQGEEQPLRVLSCQMGMAAYIQDSSAHLAELCLVRLCATKQPFARPVASKAAFKAGCNTNASLEHATAVAFTATDTIHSSSNITVLTSLPSYFFYSTAHRAGKIAMSKKPKRSGPASARHGSCDHRYKYD